VRIDRLRKNYNIEICWTAFPLHPETPEQGQTLEELFAGRSFDVKAAMLRIKQMANQVGLPMAERTKTYNSRLAQELAKWAESRGKGDQYHQAVFQAYYVSGSNIGKVDVLANIAESVGLSGKEARSVLEERMYRGSVDADWIRSRELGITAVPTFVMNRQSNVGAKPYEVLEGFIRAGGAERRNTEDGT
jgi:predicted DsbA family dithiol-disulfide isomerase